MKFIIKINNNSLCFSKYYKETNNENLNNTNIIDTKSLIFSDEYINDNNELIISFLNVITIKNSIDKIIIKQMDIAPFTIKLIKKIDLIHSIVITEDTTLSFDTFYELEQCDNINYINCYNIFPFMFDRLSIYRKINIETRLETLYVNDFMNYNNLNKYSNIYYKKSLIIKKINEDDLYNINMFFKINNNLKYIKFEDFDYDMFLKVIDICKNNFKNNLKLIIKVNSENSNYIKKNFKAFQILSKTLKKRYNYHLKLEYSKDYIQKNLLKQTNLNIVKTIFFLTILLTILIIIMYHYNNNKTFKNIQNIKKIIKEDNITDNNYENKNEVSNPNYNKHYYEKYNKTFDNLIKINSETVGWLTINNTTIDYPIVKHNDNTYYLSKDFYQSNNTNGWLFMDYRNNIDELDDNTIIYGHETDLKIMFGDLKKVLNKTWYMNNTNQIITFNTLNENLSFQIFSIYTINNTDDYLYNKFYDNNERINFYTKLKNRSIYNFNVAITDADKILTLSTCYKNDKKLVVHAKLIK